MEKLKLTIVYDNEAEEGLIRGWGFSCYIKTEEENILFDTGGDGRALLHNLRVLDISSQEITKVILSHEHGDHTGGLFALLNTNPEIEVYVPVSFSKRLKNEIASQARLIEVSEAQEICRNIYTTGELGSGVREQSLIVDSGSGLYVITGCSHPGLTEIMGTASKFGTVVGIIGGLHGSTEYDLLKGLNLIGAGHCTAHKKEIARKFPDAFLEIGAGLSLEL
ncbi:MBL fold metallo-hydrolase [Methanococcoides sp. NM1]|uniref:MBL fold metallo-hydrolase n=1 Tax=Methanococcoides sp. NM1 TaxID=1201013 RepID=UPI00352B7B0B